jgi:hypothetical protein
MKSTTPCIPNIGPTERRKRMWVGLAGLGLGIVIAVALVGMGAPRLWRVPVLFPFWVGALGFVQARDKT